MSRIPTSWDRTAEFRHFIEDFHFTIQSTASASTSTVAPTEVQSEFTHAASVIGNELNKTNDKIRELERLAQRRGIFDDRSAEIQALTYEIRQSVVHLSSQIENLARQAPPPTATHDAAHHRSVTQALRARWGEATMQLKKLLELRAETMKAQEDRRSLYSHSGVTSRRAAVIEEQVAATSSLDDTERGHLLEEQQGGTQMFTTTLKKQVPLYQSARAEAVESVQRMVGELAQIFNRVAALVTQQEELTVRIEDDMSSALRNLHEGETHLLKYFRSISSNRSLILKVFLILLAFIIFFVVFLS